MKAEITQEVINNLRSEINRFTKRLDKVEKDLIERKNKWISDNTHANGSLRRSALDLKQELNILTKEITIIKYVEKPE